MTTSSFHGLLLQVIKISWEGSGKQSTQTSMKSITAPYIFTHTIPTQVAAILVCLPLPSLLKCIHLFDFYDIFLFVSLFMNLVYIHSIPHGLLAYHLIFIHYPITKWRPMGSLYFRVQRNTAEHVRFC